MVDGLCVIVIDHLSKRFVISLRTVNSGARIDTAGM